jgi:hypothetical protein
MSKARAGGGGRQKRVDYAKLSTEGMHSATCSEVALEILSGECFCNARRYVFDIALYGTCISKHILSDPKVGGCGGRRLVQTTAAAEPVLRSAKKGAKTRQLAVTRASPLVSWVKKVSDLMIMRVRHFPRAILL